MNKLLTLFSPSRLLSRGSTTLRIVFDGDWEFNDKPQRV